MGLENCTVVKAAQTLEVGVSVRTPLSWFQNMRSLLHAVKGVSFSEGYLQA